MTDPMTSSSDAEADGGGVELRPLVRSTSPPASPQTIPRSILPHTPVDLHPRRPPPVAVDLEDIDHTFADNKTLLEAEANSQKAGGHEHGHGGGPGGSTPRQTVINIFISFVGAGMLGMPYAFSRSGWALGVMCLCAVSTANVYCMLLLVKTRRRLELNGHRNIEGYGDVGRIVLGEQGETLVNTCLIISQVGFATAYIIFIAANLTSIFPGIGRAVICYGCVPMLSVLVQVKDMAVLTPFSLFADVANLSGTTAVFMQDFKAFSHHETIKAYDWSNFLYVTAVSVYSLEGVGMVLPLETSCSERKSFPKILTWTVVGITLLIASFGVAGYAAFGPGTQAPVTLNVDGAVASFVKLALSIALYLTYPIMFYPVWLVAPLSGPFRAAAVVGTAAVAHAVPSFGKFLGLVGASICTLLGFIIPAMLHIKVFHYEKGPQGDGLKRWELWLDYFFIGFGIVFGVLGTYDSFMALFDHTEGGGHR